MRSASELLLEPGSAARDRYFCRKSLGFECRLFETRAPVGLRITGLPCRVEEVSVAGAIRRPLEQIGPGHRIRVEPHPALPTSRFSGREVPFDESDIVHLIPNTFARRSQQLPRHVRGRVPLRLCQQT